MGAQTHWDQHGAHAAGPGWHIVSSALDCGRQSGVPALLPRDVGPTPEAGSGRVENYRQRLARLCCVPLRRGTDRTGLLALVLLALAGATEEEIIADYLLSYERINTGTRRSVLVINWPR